MSSDIHQRLMSHYRTRHTKHKPKAVESIVKQTFSNKKQHQDDMSPAQDFLRNEQHIAVESSPLDFRELPGDLKVYFPGPPQPPPPLKETPYTYEMVPLVPVRIPKQKRGQVGKWVLEESHWAQQRHRSVSEYKQAERFHLGIKNMAQKKKIFREAVKKLAAKMQADNLSLGEITRKGMVKKSMNYYNSGQFFAMVKAGDKEVQRLLQANPYLAFDVDDFKMTGLHWAAREGHAYLTRILLTKFRANTGAKDIYGRTPLHLAVAKKQIPCIIRIFIEGGQLHAQDNEKRTVRSVAPDAYTKYLLQKLQEVKFIIRAKGLRDMGVYRAQLQKHVKYILDQASLYF